VIVAINYCMFTFGCFFSVLSHILRNRCMGVGKSRFSALQTNNKVACFKGR